MIRYFCSTCKQEVSNLYVLVNLTSKLSSGNRPEWSDAGFRQDHVCKPCVTAIKRFIAGLGAEDTAQTPTGEDATATIQ